MKFTTLGQLKKASERVVEYVDEYSAAIIQRMDLADNQLQSVINRKADISHTHTYTASDITFTDGKNLQQKIEELFDLVNNGNNSGGSPGPGPIRHNIINNLTNCTTSNSNSSVIDGESYLTTISANDGYKIGTITVIMGGQNVTFDAVHDNDIFIVNVIGDVVITATAIKEEFGGGGTVSDGIVVNPSSFVAVVGTEYVKVPITLTTSLPNYSSWEVRRNGQYFGYCYREGDYINISVGSLVNGVYDNLVIAAREYVGGQYNDLAISNPITITMIPPGGGTGSDSFISPIQDVFTPPYTPVDIVYTTSSRVVKHELSYDEGRTFVEINVTNLYGETYKFVHEGVSNEWGIHKRVIRVTDTQSKQYTSNVFSIIVTSTAVSEKDSSPEDLDEDLPIDMIEE